MVKREKANYLIQSVSHSLDVLEELCKNCGEIGVTELSKRLKLHKNNVFRLLATLEIRGYVEQNPSTEDYRLGVKSLQLGQAYMIQSTLVQKAYPILKKLSDDIGETVSLAMLQNGYVQYPLSIEAKKPVKVSQRVATSLFAKSCAVGKLLTAQLPDAQLAEVLSTNTPQDVAIKNQLNELRSSGLIIDRGAIEADVVAIGKVVKSASDVVAAIEVLTPQYRAKPENYITLIDMASKELSNSLAAIKPPQVSGLSSNIEKEVINPSMTAKPHAAPSVSGHNASTSRPAK